MAPAAGLHAIDEVRYALRSRHSRICGAVWSVRVTTNDEDQQEVVVDEPMHGEFFGFASMLQEIDHQTSAMAMEEAV